jgi:phosphohistidine phosphatase
MKRIIFMRHGQAEEGADGIPDFERSLTTKGKNVTRNMARKFREKIKDPGVLVSSPAFRAIETAMIFGKEFDIKPERIILNNSIYSRFNHNELMEILERVGENVDSVTLFGHNPSFTEMVTWYSKGPVNTLPKSGIVCISFPTRIWSEIRTGTGNPEIFYEPKRIL